MKHLCTVILVIFVLSVPYLVQLSSDLPNPSNLNYNNNVVYTDSKINCFNDTELAFTDLRTEWTRVKIATQTSGKRMCSNTEV